MDASCVTNATDIIDNKLITSLKNVLCNSSRAAQFCCYLINLASKGQSQGTDLVTRVKHVYVKTDMFPC